MSLSINKFWRLCTCIWRSRNSIQARSATGRVAGNPDANQGCDVGEKLVISCRWDASSESLSDLYSWTRPQTCITIIGTNITVLRKTS